MPVPAIVPLFSAGTCRHYRGTTPVYSSFQVTRKKNRVRGGERLCVCVCGGVLCRVSYRVKSRAYLSSVSKT